MQTLESPGYVTNLTRIREQYEESYIRKFNGIHESRLNYIADLIIKQGLHSTLALRSLGFDLVFRDALVSFFREWINVGQNHGMNEIQLQLSMAEKWSSPYHKGINNANNYYDAYAVKLAGVTDQALLKKTQEIIQDSIKTGETIRNTVKKLEQLYPDFSKGRLENIVRTESGKCYNWGRLNSFYQNTDVIDGVRFSAILDGRTTDICIARNGLILPLTDQEGIASNTPPLHYQCRSIWTPIAIGQIGKRYAFNKDQYQPIMEKMPPMDGFGYQDLSGITKLKQLSPITIPTLLQPKQPTINPIPSKPPAQDDEVYGALFNKNLSPDIQDEIKRSFRYYHERGLTKVYEDEVEVFTVLLDKLAYAGSIEDRLLLLNQSCFVNRADLLKKMRYDVQAFYHPPSCFTIKSIIDHEVGHNLHHRITQSSYGQVFNNIINQKYIKFYRNYLSYRNLLDADKYAGSILSVYGAKNYQEFMAEAWTEFMNNKKCRQLALSVGRSMVKYLKLIGVFKK